MTPEENDHQSALVRMDERELRIQSIVGTGGNFSPQQKRSMAWQAAYDARIRAAWERLFREQEHGI